MACIFNTVVLDLSAAIAHSFEGMGAYSRGGLLEDYSTSRLCLPVGVAVVLFRRQRHQLHEDARLHTAADVQEGLSRPADVPRCGVARTRLQEKQPWSQPLIKYAVPSVLGFAKGRPAPARPQGRARRLVAGPGRQILCRAGPGPIFGPPAALVLLQHRVVE